MRSFMSSHVTAAAMRADGSPKAKGTHAEQARADAATRVRR